MRVFEWRRVGLDAAMTNRAVRNGVIDSRLRILWMTNLAAPYRMPVWASLAEKNALSVVLLESNAQLAADGPSNRGADWQLVTPKKFQMRAIATWKVPRGEARYYILRNIRTIFQLRNFDVMVFGGWESPAYWQLLLIAVLFRRRRVAFYESPSNTHRYQHGPVAWMRRRFYRAMHGVVVPGAAAKSAVLDMGVSLSALTEGFNAVDVRRFRHAVTALSADDQPEALDGHRFLFAGQLIPRKRVDRIIETFSQISSSEDQLAIVGTGPLEDELKGLALDRQASTLFHGYVDGIQMPALMAENHTLVLSSAQEVWGLVVNEALASGMHVVVAENCGVVSSVRAMHGVFVVQEDLSDLDQQMKNSRDTWSGRILQPEILQYTPEKFADVFQSVFDRLSDARG